MYLKTEIKAALLAVEDAEAIIQEWKEELASRKRKMKKLILTSVNLAEGAYTADTLLEKCKAELAVDEPTYPETPDPVGEESINPETVTPTEPADPDDYPSMDTPEI